MHQSRGQGVLTLDRTASRPLEAGANEVVLAISDVFGRWGLMGSLRPEPGVELADR